MNQEGFGSNGSAFEYTVPREGSARTRKKLLLLGLYALWVIVIFALGVWSRILLPLLCFIPLSLWILVFLTWRLSQKEIKLSFFAGKLTVIRMYDGKNPKTLAEIPLKGLRTMAPYHPGDELRLKGKRIIYATRTGTPQDAYLATWGDSALLFEANEKALKIIKYYHGT